MSDCQHLSSTAGKQSRNEIDTDEAGRPKMTRWSNYCDADFYPRLHNLGYTRFRDTSNVDPIMLQIHKILGIATDWAIHQIIRKVLCGRPSSTTRQRGLAFREIGRDLVGIGSFSR